MTRRPRTSWGNSAKLIGCTLVLALAAPQASRAVNLIVDASTSPATNTPGVAVEPRDGGAGIAPWSEFYAPNYPTSDPTPTRPGNNGEKQPAWILDNGNIRGDWQQQGNGPTDGDGRKALVMFAGERSNASKTEVNEYDTGLSTTTSQYMEATFRGINYNNNNGGTTAPGDILGSATNHGDGIMMLQLKNGPAIGIEVFNGQSADGKDVYAFNLVKFHTDSEVVPLQTLGLFHPNPSDGGTQSQSAYHTADLYVNSVTGQVQVAWDGVKVFDQIIAPWSTSGSPFLDSVDGTATFADKSSIVHGGNSNESTAAFSYVQLSNMPIGGLVPEPSSFVLAGLGVLGLAGCAYRRKFRN